MKILVTPYSQTLSHISRPLAVALELEGRGHEIVITGAGPKTTFLKEQGFEVLPLYETDHAEIYGNIRAGKLRFVSNEEVERLVDADLKLLNEIKPDMILTDGRFSAAISTQILGLNHCAIVNVSSTEYRALPYVPFFEWMPGNLSRYLNLFNLSIEMAVFNNTMRIFSDLSRKYNLQKTITATNCLAGNDLTLLADIPEYFPTKNLPANYHYIGPLTWKSCLPEPSWWPPQTSTGKIVYITMGTTGISDFFPRVYNLFKNSHHTAVLTTGGQVSGLENIDRKLYVADFLDGDSMMEASDLVVCHGGNGTIYQALQHGKPVIGIPTIPDQKFNMRRVEALELGKALSWKDFMDRPATLLDLIDEICSAEVFFDQAASFKNKLTAYNPASLAADLIEKSFDR